MEKEILKRLHNLYNRNPDGAWDMGYNAAVKQAIKIVGEEAAHGQPNWISSDEQMPPKCERVLIVAEPIAPDAKQFEDVAWFDAGLWWLDSKHAVSRHHYKVARWMPLSE